MKVQHIKEEVDGRSLVKVRLTYPEFPAGAFKELDSILDAMFYHVYKRLGLPVHSYGSKVQIIQRFKTDLGIDSGSISRCRNEKYLTHFPESWVVRLHVYSGIPMKELLAIANYTDLVSHPNKIMEEEAVAIKATAYDSIKALTEAANSTEELRIGVYHLVQKSEVNLRLNQEAK